MQIPEATKVDVAVPGWHINGHGESCRTIFNLGYMEGAVRMVGKDVETIWAGTNRSRMFHKLLQGAQRNIPEYSMLIYNVLQHGRLWKVLECSRMFYKILDNSRKVQPLEKEMEK